MSGSFFDTNVLIDLLGRPAEAAAARSVLAYGGTISVQVLNEATHVVRRKFGLGWEETRDFLKSIRGLLDVVPVTIETHDLALELAMRYRYTIYDSLILAAALRADCDTLWSRDMQPGQRIGGLTIRAPGATP